MGFYDFGDEMHDRDDHQGVHLSSNKTLVDLLQKKVEANFKTLESRENL